jgi:hypothetical protein
MNYKSILILIMLMAIPCNSYSIQSSESPAITLGVRDANGEYGSYKAVFIVTGIKGQVVQYNKHPVYKTEINGFGDKIIYVNFPKDFAEGALNGTYVWKCLINNRNVANGQFELSVGNLKIKFR